MGYNGIYCSKHQQRYEKTLGKPKEHDLIMVGVRFFLGGSPTSRTKAAASGRDFWQFVDQVAHYLV